MKGVTRPLEHSVEGRVRRSKADAASGEAVSWCVAVALNMGLAIMGVKEEMTSHQIFCYCGWENATEIL